MEILSPVLQVILVLLALVALYFFAVTRLAVAIKAFQQKPASKKDHLYWLYTNPLLIRLTDNRFVVSAVLLFQYDRLVGELLKKMDPLPRNGRVLQVSCAYGNFSNRVAKKCLENEASELVVCDILGNQLENVRRKLSAYDRPLSLVEGDATALEFKDNSFDSVLVFFLLHEMPFKDKRETLAEAMRVVKPGGKVILAEFQKPKSRFLRLTGWLYFSLFEPFALEMWNNFCPERFIRETGPGRWVIEKQSYFYDNFQVLSAAKQKPFSKINPVKKAPARAEV